MGGIEQTAMDTVLALQNQYTQKLISFSENENSSVSEIAGIEVTKVGVKHKFRSQSLSLIYFFKLFKLITKSVQVIHFHAPNPLISVYLSLIILLRRSSASLIVHWHSDIIEQKFLRRLYKPFQDLLLSQASYIIVTSPPYANSPELVGHESKIVMIPNCFNEEKLRLTSEDIEMTEKLRLQYSDKLMFFAGRHVRYKGLPYLIEAAKKLPELSFVIAGEGPETAKLKESATTGNVSFLGKIPTPSLRSYLKAATVFVFPSITKNEAFGIALVEANCLGTPCAVFNIPDSGVPWVIEDHVTGIVSPEISVDGLVESILAASALKKESQKISDSAYSRFSYSQVFKPEILKLYNRAFKN